MTTTAMKTRWATPAGASLGRAGACVRTDEKRALILAAIETVVALGANGLRASHVAAEAGVDPQVVKHHFATPARLATAVVEHVIDELIESIDQREPTTVGRRLAALASVITERPALSLVLAELELRGRRDPLIRAAVDRAESRWRAALAAIFEMRGHDASSTATLVAAVAKGVRFNRAEDVAETLEQLGRLLAGAGASRGIEEMRHYEATAVRGAAVRNGR
jgi:AcrR family transcriptional regulator